VSDEGLRVIQGGEVPSIIQCRIRYLCGDIPKVIVVASHYEPRYLQVAARVYLVPCVSKAVIVFVTDDSW